MQCLCLTDIYRTIYVSVDFSSKYINRRTRCLVCHSLSCFRTFVLRAVRDDPRRSVSLSVAEKKIFTSDLTKRLSVRFHRPLIQIYLRARINTKLDLDKFYNFWQFNLIFFLHRKYFYCENQDMIIEFILFMFYENSLY